MSTPRKSSSAATGKKSVPAGKKAAAARRAAPKPAGPADPAKGSAKTPPPPPGPGLVVGTVPPLTRVAGGVALVAAVLLLIAPVFPLATVGDTDLGAGGVGGVLAALPLVAAVAAAGLTAARGILPRLGLAVLFPAGTLAAGFLLRALYLQQTGDRSTLDLPLGLAESARYEAGTGLVLATVGYGMLVAAAVLGAVGWPRTIMEDGGDLDPRRPRLAAWGLAVGVLIALFVGMAPWSSTIAPGAPTLPERDGLDLLGALVVALGAAAWAVLAATLRPRLATVGAYAGLAAGLATEGLSILRTVAGADRLGPTVGGIGVLVMAFGVAALALVAARLGRLVTPTPPAQGGRSPKA